MMPRIRIVFSASEQLSRVVIRSAGWWLPLLVSVVVGLLYFPHSRDDFFEQFSAGAWIGAYRRPIARACFVVLTGIPLAQLVVAGVWCAVAHLAQVRSIGGAKNKWPQRLIGMFENGAYALAFAIAEPKEVLAGVAAWVTFKTFTDWPRWKAEPNAPDADLPKRRFYVFLIANVIQVATGAAIGFALSGWALEP